MDDETRKKLSGIVSDGLADAIDEMVEVLREVPADLRARVLREFMRPLPIETAPRDGTEIIGIWRDDTDQEYAAVMRWIKEWPMPEPGDRPGWWGYYHSVTQIEFADDADRAWIKAPTHWLPYESPF